MLDSNPSLESDSYGNRRSNLNGLESELSSIQFGDPYRLNLTGCIQWDHFIVIMSFICNANDGNLCCMRHLHFQSNRVELPVLYGPVLYKYMKLNHFKKFPDFNCQFYLHGSCHLKCSLQF